MPALKNKLCDLHVAPSWESLVAKAESLKLDKSVSYKNLLASLDRIYDRALLDQKLGDEESAFLLLHRFVDIVIWKLPACRDYSKDQEIFVKKKYGSKLQNAVVACEELKSSLMRRYVLQQKATDHDKITQPEVSTTAVENQSNCVFAVPETALNELRKDENVKFYITPTEVYKHLHAKDKSLLIIDVRSCSDFGDSHINVPECINVPEDMLFKGITAQTIECKLPYDSRKEFQKRGDVDIVVIMDWCLKLVESCHNDTVIAISDAINIHTTERFPKNRPLLLQGGYFAWLELYPTVLTKLPSAAINSNTAENMKEKVVASDYPVLKDTHPQDVGETKLREFTPINGDANLDQSEPLTKVVAYPVLDDSDPLDYVSKRRGSGTLSEIKSSDASVLPVTFESNDAVVKSGPSNPSLKIDRSTKPVTNSSIESRSSVVNESSTPTTRTLPSQSIPAAPDRSRKPVEPLVLRSSASDNVTITSAKSLPEPAAENTNAASEDVVYVDLAKLPKPSLPAEELAKKVAESRTEYVEILPRGGISVPSSAQSSDMLSTAVAGKTETVDNVPHGYYNGSNLPSDAPVRTENAAALEAERLRKLKLPSSTPGTKTDKTSGYVTNDMGKDNRYDKDADFHSSKTYHSGFGKSDISNVPVFTASERTALEKAKHFEKLRDEEPQCSRGMVTGGLRRSDSSPNVAKLGLNGSCQNDRSPAGFDRNKKPRGSSAPLDKERREPELDDFVLRYFQKPRSFQEVDSSRVTPLTTGLRNLGNTCFMNSVIQCLCHSVPLLSYMVSKEFLYHINTTNRLGFKGQIAIEFYHVLNLLNVGQYRYFAPIDFKNCVSHHRPMFYGSQQHDSQEFLVFLLDSLHEDLNQVKQRIAIPEQNNDENCDLKQAACNAWQWHLAQNSSKIVDLFQGQYKSTVECSTCKKQSITFDTFMYVTLPVPKNKSSCSLAECFKLFSLTENMTGECRWKCPRCKVLREATKYIELWKLPKLLLIHLKRFVWEGRWRSKLNTFVDFPVSSLDMTPFVKGETPQGKYNLYAFSHHTGTLEGGHYTALCKNSITRSWYKFDDTDVTTISESNIKTPGAYILFYTCDSSWT